MEIITKIIEAIKAFIVALKDFLFGIKQDKVDGMKDFAEKLTGLEIPSIPSLQK